MVNHLRTKQLIVLLLAMVVLASCKQEKDQELVVNNLLLKEWTGPYGGVPAFDQMKVEDVKLQCFKAWS